MFVVYFIGELVSMVFFFRAYIEWPWKPNEKAKVHNGVYMALKMK